MDRRKSRLSWDEYHVVEIPCSRSSGTMYNSLDAEKVTARDLFLPLAQVLLIIVALLMLASMIINNDHEKMRRVDCRCFVYCGGRGRYFGGV